MDTLIFLTGMNETSIAEEGLIKTAKDKIKASLRKKKEAKKEQEKYSPETHDFSYRNKACSEVLKKAKPIIEKYTKLYPKVFKYANMSHETDFKSGESGYLSLVDWDLWEFNPNARTDDKKNEEFDKIYLSLVKELSSITPDGYKITEIGDWDDGTLAMEDTDYSRAKKKVATESIDFISLLSNETNIAEEGLIKTVKDKFKELKEKNRQLKEARKEQSKKLKEASDNKKSEITEEDKHKASEVKEFIITLAKTAVKKYHLLKDIADIDEFEDYGYCASVEICDPQDFYDYDDEKMSKLWDEWLALAELLVKQAKAKYPNVKITYGDGDEGCIYIEI